jgi:hypothetical protein
MAAFAAVMEVVGGLISLVCFILVLVKMFQRGKTRLGILCIVLTLCCGAGHLITFIYGWVKSGEWGIRNVMVAWTVGLVLAVAGGAMNPPDIQQLQQIQQRQLPR